MENFIANVLLLLKLVRVNVKSCLSVCFSVVSYASNLALILQCFAFLLAISKPWISLLTISFVALKQFLRNTNFREKWEGMGDSDIHADDLEWFCLRMLWSPISLFHCVVRLGKSSCTCKTNSLVVFVTKVRGVPS